MEWCEVRRVITTSGSLLSSPWDVSTTSEGLDKGLLVVLVVAVAEGSSFCLSLMLVLVLLLLGWW